MKRVILLFINRHNSGFELLFFGLGLNKSLFSNGRDRPARTVQA